MPFFVKPGVSERYRKNDRCREVEDRDGRFARPGAFRERVPQFFVRELVDDATLRQ